MKVMPWLMLAALVPAPQEPALRSASQEREGGSAEALKRETCYSALQRRMLPMLPHGAIVDVVERKTEKGDELSCFLSWSYDLETEPCARLRQQFLDALKAAGVDLAKPDFKAYAAAAAKVLWHEIYEKEAAARLAELQKKLDVKTPPLRIGASISFRLGASTQCLTSMGSTKEWAFVSP
jgi:hypothetical protein